MPDDEVLPDAPPAVQEEQPPKHDAQDEHSEGSAAPQETSTAKLEDLFDDDDDDDYPFSSASEPGAQGSEAEPAEQPGPPPAKIDSETMYAFYQLVKPWGQTVRRLWESRIRVYTSKRRISTLPIISNSRRASVAKTRLSTTSALFGELIGLRDRLRNDILRLNPSRFEIGPVYSTNPRDRKTLRKSSAFRPVSKELVFDIDLTDYDDIRTCCEKANICSKCWAFVTMAVKVIDCALRDDFGFEHILWVYSGRRGAHAWVCDQRARNLADDRRRAIAGYLEVVRGGAQSGKRVNVKRPLHPHITRSLEVLRPYFGSTVLNDQDTFSSWDQASRLLQLIPDKSLKDSLQKKWESAPSRASSLKWSDIDKVAKTSGGRSLDTKALLEAKQDIVLEYTYPRLDAEVSKKMIHLLKSPFVVHPGTGRVCVPIDIRKVEQFNPLEVPTVTELLDEINAWDLKHKGDHGPGSDRDTKRNTLQDYEKTSLKPYIDHFRAFVANLNRDERAGKRERDEDGHHDEMEF
ncbi:DNA primase small subunit [Uncinocarpus reesii 1704]|uniref:DNA primase n=1 Tax=Uncinocarpus reesii (strain UAMH 1704) TaxID=336963 RepID=C4JX14_UNCRE|nr:DNA primase small subunit [Uncinocarpus reesii 1704]EEP81322.1 DNA primase small subunit [Uncinocarpus reesii 1704]